MSQSLINNQNSQQVLKASQQPALKDCNESKDRLDERLAGCLTLQKMYGRAPDSMETVTELFHSILGQHPAAKVIKAFDLWLERSQEFPTPADIIGLIKRNGRPPIKESEIIAIRKKDGADRTSEDWELLRIWEAERNDGWSSEPAAKTDHLQDNIALRKRVMELEGEVKRLTELLREERIARGQEKPQPDKLTKVRGTVEMMKATGAPPADIDEFLASEGVTIEQLAV